MGRLPIKKIKLKGCTEPTGMSREMCQEMKEIRLFLIQKRLFAWLQNTQKARRLNQQSKPDFIFRRLIIKEFLQRIKFISIPKTEPIPLPKGSDGVLFLNFLVLFYYTTSFSFFT